MIVLLVLLVSGLALYSYFNNKRLENSDSDKDDSGTIVDNNLGVLNETLSTCPSDLSGMLTHEIFDMNDLDYSMPLGMLAPGGHTIPTDHMCLAHMGQKRIPIYAPGDVTIVFMDDKMTYDAQTDVLLHDDYSVEIALCRGLSVSLNHFSEISPEIEAAWAASEKQCDAGQYHFGTDMSTYYSPCQSYFQKGLKAGDLMGYIGTFEGGTVTLSTAIDFGAYNFNSEPLAFANPSRYSDYNLHAMCGLDLFTEELRTEYYGKLAYIEHNISSGQPEVILRVGEPLCGETMQDISGTLQGNWFAGNPGIGSNSTEYMMALVHNITNYSIPEISLEGQTELGGNISFNFTAMHIGAINREFSEVTPGEQIYCYQDVIVGGSGTQLDKKGNPVDESAPKYLIRLVDETHLQIEKKAGVCGVNEEFASPFTYER